MKTNKVYEIPIKCMRYQGKAEREFLDPESVFFVCLHLVLTGRLFNSATLLFKAVVIRSRILSSDKWLRIAYAVFC